uniref:Uncharacterized protein n=1 Tax=Tanacetum cinerariifolium TaxID=118510 RepID=A0A699HVU2_TANCI|nr:hypothetical protein [Tanacetum cinerariifolium]
MSKEYRCWFKPHKEYRPVSKKSTASSNGNKKKGVEPTIEVSNSNLFDVLNLVNNDGEFGTNEGLLIWKFKDLLTSGQAILVDKAGNPLKKVEFLGDNDNEDERDLYGNGDYDDDPYDDDMYKARELLVTQLVMYQTRYGKPLPIVVPASSSRLGGP